MVLRRLLLRSVTAAVSSYDGWWAGVGGQTTLSSLTCSGLVVQIPTTLIVSGSTFTTRVHKDDGRVETATGDND